MSTEKDALVRLVQSAIQAHRDLHTMYGNTAACGGGIGGAALTQHCGVTCGYHERHQSDNDRWYDVERAYFRMQEGDPEWADYIPGGRLSTSPIRPAGPECPECGDHRGWRADERGEPVQVECRACYEHERPVRPAAPEEERA